MYDTSEENAKKVFDFYERKIAGKKPKHQQGRGLGLMEKGLVSAKGWPSFIFMPADLQDMLGSSTAKKPKAVINYGGK